MEFLGDVPIAPYGRPGTQALPASLGDALRSANVVVMERHGSVTVGKDIYQAFDFLDMLEHNADITARAMAMGGEITPLPAEEIEYLTRAGEKLGVLVKKPPCHKCNACKKGEWQPPKF